MEEAGLLDLPDELLLHLSHYLTVTDILSCCLVCRKLRELLNDNEVWRRRVPLQPVSRLESLEQVVSPRLPAVWGSVREQRTLYNTNTRLLRNWTSGNCVEFNTKADKSGLQCLPMFDNKYRERSILYKGRYLFIGRLLNYKKGDAVNVWDVASVPELYTTVLASSKNYEDFFIVDSKLLIVECIKVIVYEITLPEKEFPLLYSFFVDQSSVTPKQVLNDRQCYCERATGGVDGCFPWRRPGCCGPRCDGWNHSSVDQYLVSQRFGFYDSEGTAVHVWDISEGTKLGSFFPPQPGLDIKFNCKADDKWFFCQQTSGGCYTLLQFDIKKGQTFDNVLNYEGNDSSIIVYNGAVILCTSPMSFFNKTNNLTCIVYDLGTGVELNRRQFNHPYGLKEYRRKSVVVFDGKFVVLSDNSFHVIDALSLETIAQFPSGDVSYIAHQFKVLHSVFVLTVRRRHHLELWDIENKRKVCVDWRMHSDSRVLLNDSSSALIYYGHVGRCPTVCVVHFW